MDLIAQDSPRTFLSGGWNEHPVSNRQIRGDSGFIVRDFAGLVECVSKVAYYNPAHVLLYRGQNRDYHKASEGLGLTVIKPSIFRAVAGQPLIYSIPKRYSRLARAEKFLVDLWLHKRLEEPDRIVRTRLLRWAILQHYEVCRTPLLDVTHSLRVAASIACLGSTHRFVYLYVLAVPQLSGTITASAEAGLEIVRLSSICPPSARRPHFQEGYLIGEYPEIPTAAEKDKYRAFENDCCRRLLAKFRLERTGFWNENFPRLPRKALFPEPQPGDGLEEIIAVIKTALGPEWTFGSREGPEVQAIEPGG